MKRLVSRPNSRLTVGALLATAFLAGILFAQPEPGTENLIVATKLQLEHSAVFGRCGPPPPETPELHDSTGTFASFHGTLFWCDGSGAWQLVSLDP